MRHVQFTAPHFTATSLLRCSDLTFKIITIHNNNNNNNNSSSTTSSNCAHWVPIQLFCWQVAYPNGRQNGNNLLWCPHSPYENQGGQGHWCVFPHIASADDLLEGSRSPGQLSAEPPPPSRYLKDLGRWVPMVMEPANSHHSFYTGH